MQPAVSAAGCRRHSEVDLSLSVRQTPILPFSPEDAFTVGHQWLAVAEFALVTGALERHDTLPMRLSICEFALISAGAPFLRAAAGLAAQFPLSIILLQCLTALRSLQTAWSLSQSVDAPAGPAHGFLGQRMGIPDPATAVGVRDECSCRARLPVGCRTAQKRAQKQSVSSVSRYLPIPCKLRSAHDFHRCSSGSTTLCSNSSRTSMNLSRTTPSRSIT
jgi:hypothetical protein